MALRKSWSPDGTTSGKPWFQGRAMSWSGCATACEGSISNPLPFPRRRRFIILACVRRRWHGSSVLKALPLKEPSRALYSSIGRRFISPHEDIAVLLASQLLRPFDFQGGISDVTEAGVTKFVDCGSSGSLAKIIAKAGAEGLDVSCIGKTDDGGPAAVRSPGPSGASRPDIPPDRGQGPGAEPTPHRRNSPAVKDSLLRPWRLSGRDVFCRRASRLPDNSLRPSWSSATASLTSDVSIRTGMRISIPQSSSPIAQPPASEAPSKTAR